MTASDVTAIVREQIEAYNARDLDRTLSYYAPDATTFGSHGTVMAEGHDAIRAAYENVFAENPEVHAEAPVIFHVGEWVAIHSIVPDWLMCNGSRLEMQWIEVYRVIEGKIKELHLYR